ncbi:MAG: thiol-disulfide oxidoreductase DCC family protein [Chitinophagales bacterium]|nr:thiol-disulfide oxidoreductase DCC family protein [Chitinophagales bacterium]
MSDVLTDKVVLFDGVCNFCDSSVQFIIKHDKSNSLKFASLQSEFGQNLLKQFNHTTALESVVFFENNQIYTKSTAAFHIANYFGGFWKVLSYLRFFPTFITDFFYDIVAKNRYKWFGKKDSCMIPTPEIRNRFIEI